MTASIHGCRVVSPGADLPAATIRIESGTIIAVDAIESDPAQDRAAAGLLRRTENGWDARGLIAVPGFIDIHTHGADGADLADATVEAVQRIAAAKLREGVTTFLPTTLSLDRARLTRCLEAAAAYRAAPTGARTPAIHLEGPFLNPARAGAQNPHFIRPPDLGELLEHHRDGPLAVVSIAPEMPGALECIRAARERGITVSLAHSAATLEEFRAAKDAGASHLTHFFNQMSPLHHREPGLVGAGFLDDDIRLELICDNIHLVPETIALVFKFVPASRIMLITDSMAASHLGDGEFEIGGLKVNVRNAEARLENGALAGSTLRYNEGIRNVLAATGLALPDIIAATAWNQAESLGLDGIGKLVPGFAADITLLDRDLNVAAAFVEGAMKFSRSAHGR